MKFIGDRCVYCSSKVYDNKNDILGCRQKYINQCRKVCHFECAAKFEHLYPENNVSNSQSLNSHSTQRWKCNQCSNRYFKQCGRKKARLRSFLFNVYHLYIFCVCLL